MAVRQRAGDAGLRLWSRARIWGALLAVLVATGWGTVEAEAPVRPLDHHAAVLNGRIVGSAFLIAGDLALTNAHVVAGLAPGALVTLVSESGAGAATAQVVAVSPRMDLAVLRAPEGFLPVVPARDAASHLGLAVRGAGVDASSGRGMGPRLELPGAVIDPETTLGAFGPGLVISMPGVRPGFSGGPVLDAEGRLVGMITAIRSSDAVTLRASRGAAHQRPADEAFVLRAAEIRAEAARLLKAAR